MLALGVSICVLAGSGCAKKPEDRTVTMNPLRNVPPPARATAESSPIGESTAPEAKAGLEAAKPEETKGPQPPRGEPEKPGKLVKTPSGLEYQDLRVGTGKSPRLGDTVVVNYRGTFKSDGKEFDSSYKRGKPAEFELGKVIEGWNEGLQTMKEGGKRKLIVPYKLAYREEGRPPSIPPKADLVFEVELLEVKG